MMRPLALSDAQLNQLRRAAAKLPVGRRDAFLRTVAAQLGEGTPAMPALEVAIGLALNRVAIPNRKKEPNYETTTPA
jgi:hypothetical protein